MIAPNGDQFGRFLFEIHYQTKLRLKEATIKQSKPPMKNDLTKAKLFGYRMIECRTVGTHLPWKHQLYKILLETDDTGQTIWVIKAHYELKRPEHKALIRLRYTIHMGSKQESLNKMHLKLNDVSLDTTSLMSINTGSNTTAYFINYQLITSTMNIINIWVSRAKYAYQVTKHAQLVAKKKQKQSQLLQSGCSLIWNDVLWCVCEFWCFHLSLL